MLGPSCATKIWDLSRPWSCGYVCSVIQELWYHMAVLSGGQE